MPAYLLVLGKATDRDRMAAYSRALPPIYASRGGRYVAFGGPGRGVDWLAGPVRDRSVVLARFDRRADVHGFWWSDDYRAAARLRERAGQFTVLALDGTDEDPARDAAPAAVYLVEATVTREIADYDDYRSQFDALAAAHRGRAIVRAGEAEMDSLEGDALFDRLAVTFFPDSAGVDAFLAAARTDRLVTARDRAGLVLLARAGSPPAA